MIAAAVATLLFAFDAKADWTLSGPATGVTIDNGNGTFTMAGKYTDQYSPSGIGHYYGTYSWPSGSDFSTFRDNLGQNCAPDYIGSHCNIRPASSPCSPDSG